MLIPNPRIRNSDETHTFWLRRRLYDVRDGDGVTITAVSQRSSIAMRLVLIEGDEPGKVGLIDGSLLATLCKPGEFEKMTPAKVTADIGEILLKVIAVSGGLICIESKISDLDPDFIAMAARIALLSPGEFKSKVKPGVTIEILTHDDIDSVSYLGSCVNIARWLTALPTNHLGVYDFADLVLYAFDDIEHVTVLGEPTEEQYERMGLLNAVAAGNGGRKRVVAVRIDPPDGPTESLNAYVGKTMVFDSGGLCLKPMGGRGMKGDKGGGSTLFGAAFYLASHPEQLANSVVFVWTITENSVGENAYRVDDVVTAYNGITVEIDNTDAEGRLVLADAAAWISEELKLGEGDEVCFVATLTGAAVSHRSFLGADFGSFSQGRKDHSVCFLFAESWSGNLPLQCLKGSLQSV